MSSFFDTSTFSTSSKHALSNTNTRVIPAQVNFLTIFNPSLGDTEETESDQIVFWGSKADLLASRDKVGDGKRVPLATHEWPSVGADVAEDEHELSNPEQQAEETNFRLRQIGLARGMVDFVKNFSNDKPVSSIETQKTRIILHELEQGWWILASINFTRLPISSRIQTGVSTPKSKKEHVGKDNKSTKKHDVESEQYEYSAREVAPPQLLLAQILAAHRTFMLHHAACLWDLYNRVGQARFRAHLHKFWEKFLLDWNVLLHGNPAVEVYGVCTKIAGGGELGIGVGEEKWGSGEREVLEGFVARTEGCVDLVVGRYGDPPPRKKRKTDSEASLESIDVNEGGNDRDVWLGNGDVPGPADGIIFSGIGTLSRQSLASVSQWMEAIFRYGEDAYGVGENPSARQRQRRKPQRSKMIRKVSDSPRSGQDGSCDTGRSSKSTDKEQAMSSGIQSPKNKTPDLRRQALENSALPPGIPAPLVASVERSLDDAIAKVQSRASSKSPKSSPTHEKSQEQAMEGRKGQNDTDDTSSWFDTDKMTKVFKLGYGTSWTLNPKGFGDQSPESNNRKTDNDSEDLLLPEEPSSQSIKAMASRPGIRRTTSKPAEDRLQEIDPTPEVSDEESTPPKPFLQHLEKSIGRFIIGLSGDLENTEFDDDDDDDDDPDGGTLHRKTSQRLFLRTLTIEVGQQQRRNSITSVESTASQRSKQSQNSNTRGPELKTSAAASVDGPTRPSTRHEKLQVAVYVHQPFIFVFLFSLHTPNLTIPGFYRGIHHQLGPLQIPLLKRTDPQRLAERLREVMLSRTEEDEQSNSRSSSQLELAVGGAGNTIYDLVYDPSRLTIRTSIPNIPIPTQLSDQSPTRNATVSGSWYTLGIPIGSLTNTPTHSRSTSQQRGSTSDQATKAKSEQWSRLDALSVHQQILNAYAATHSDFASTFPATMASTSKSAYSGASAAPSSALLKDVELERTEKTNRDWWVLWMRVQSVPDKSSSRSHTSRRLSEASSITSEQQPTKTSTSTLPIMLPHHADKEAFLIRKSAGHLPPRTSAKSGASSPIGGGRWLLREQPKDSRSGSGNDGSSGILTARGVGEGVGVDARKWVNGLLTLTS